MFATLQSLTAECLLPPEAPSRRTAALFAAGLTLLVFPAFRFDLPISQAVRDGSGIVPGDLHKAIDLTEAFGHLAGALLILWGVWCIDRTHRRRLVIPLGMMLASGIPVQVLKRLVGRVRPSAITEWSISAWETFGMPTGADVVFDSRYQSFPSAHAAVATALAWSLAALYPRGRWYFAILALLASTQRVTSSAHFLSDVLAGAAIASTVAAAWPRQTTRPARDA